MRKLKLFFREVPLLIAWFILSVILWGWIFSLITETTMDKKLTVAVDSVIYDRAAFAAELEQYLPDSLRMVRTYPFDYAMMGTTPISSCDLFIVPERDIERYAEWFAAIPSAIYDNYDCGEYGAVFTGCSEYISYYPENEIWYLCIGAGSSHPDTALDYALILLEKAKGNS